MPYVGEIRMFAGNFAPLGWMFCDGQTLPISEYETLFQLVGTTYGGDGAATFNLPDLRGRLPVHFGSSSTGSTYQVGQADGVEEVTLTTAQIPSHGHALGISSDNALSTSGRGRVLAQTPSYTPYIRATPGVALHPASISGIGDGHPHSNLQPTLCLSFIISLFGIYPSQA